MAFNFKVGSFTCPASTGNNSVTGLGFAPKAVLFFGNNQTADGSTGTAGTNAAMPMMKLGMATGPSNRASFGDADNFAGGSPCIDTTKCINISSSGTAIVIADFVSLDATGFTVNFTTVTSGVVINYVALGGSDLSAQVVTYTQPVTTGHFAITGAGFAPTSAIFISSNTAALSGSNSGRGMFGITDGTNQAANSSNFNNSLGNIGNYERINEVWAENDGTSDVVDATIFSMDSDGCTVNITTNTGAVDNGAVLFLKGCQAHVGSFTSPLATGNQTISGLGFTPIGLIVSSLEAVASTSVFAGRIVMTMGAADGTNQACVYLGDNANGVASLDRTKVVRYETDSSTPADDLAATLSSFNSGNFVLNYTAVNGSALELIYMAFGPTSTSGPLISRTGPGGGLFVHT